MIDKKTYEDGKSVIYVEFQGNRQPYTAYNVPRIRESDEDIVMDQDMYFEMMLIRDDGKHAWENQPSKYTVADINMRDFKTYLNKAKQVGRISFESDDPEVVMNKLELMADDGVHLLNAGAALFCDTSDTDVQMAKFATDVKATFTDIRREDKGSIIGMSKICEQYIIDAMDWKADIVGLKRGETPEIPVEAIREAVINSYGHRVYNNGQNNEIDVFKDRIEIHTTGGFPKGHTPEEYLDGNKKPIRRNRKITGVLYYSKDMETFATGQKRIKDLCDESGCKVEFRTEKDDFVVAFYRNLRETWGTQKSDMSSNVNQEMKQDETSLKRVLKQVLKQAEYNKLMPVIDFLDSNDSISVQDVINITGKSRTTAWRYLNILVEADVIEATGNTNNSVYVKK